MKKSIVLFCLFGVSALLAAGGMGGQGGPGGEPPKEAIEICEGQEKGAECSMTTPRGDTLEGTCKYTPDEKYFVCMPANAPRR